VGMGILLTFAHVAEATSAEAHLVGVVGFT